MSGSNRGSITKKEFDQVAAAKQPKQPFLFNAFWAFIYGGAICAVAQGINTLYRMTGLSATQAGTRTAVTVIFLGAALTGIGIYDSLAKRGGAGTAIPISGFANTIVSPAMEFAQEGLILGMAAKMFTVAGPVIVYGVISAVMAALARWLLLGGTIVGN